MGGIGSGCYSRHTSKNTTEDYRSIDVRCWFREKLLVPNRTFVTKWSRNGKTISLIGVKVQNQNITLTYNFQKVEFHYPVSLEWTPCNYGNKRPWFLCPAGNCRKRVAILYGGRIFACRQCHNLAYASQNENLAYRALRRAAKICRILNTEHEFLDCDKVKPKGMQWKTFRKLTKQHDVFMSKGDAYMADKSLR